MFGDIKVTFKYSDLTESPITLPQGLGCFIMGTNGLRFRYGVSFKCKPQDLIQFKDQLGTGLLTIYKENKNKLVTSVFVQSYELEDGSYTSEKEYTLSEPSPYFYDYSDGNLVMEDTCSVCNESLCVFCDE